DPPTDTLIRLAELVLNKNTFSFRDEVFSQMSGVAMGTKMGPSYACLFMGHLEHTLLQQYKKPVPEIYKRYIDDGIGATSLSYNQLLDFINFVQNFHPAVKFTYEISEKSVTFLDMKLYLKQGKLTTSVHYKSTDSHSYLDYRSSHNPSTKNSIPFSQFLRLRRLCSDDADFEEKAEEMANFFLQRRYPENTVKKALDQVRPIPRQKTLQPNSKTAAEERPIMSLLYHPSTIRVRKIILSNWSLLQARTEVAKIFSRPPLIAYKRDTNIRDMLVRSKLRQPATRTPGTTPCNQEKCKTCPFICTNVSIKGPKSKMNITKQFNCQTYNIVYVIHCTKCAKLYIGETGRTLDTRFKEHLADIKHHRDKPVANHFNQAGHSIHNIRVKGLWLLFTDNASDRKDMESHLIDKLGSRRPGGINEKL
ncbi:GIY-YIG nuclease family protein, partial [Thiolapillus sp.]